MTTSTPSPNRRIGQILTPPIQNDLGEVTANYPVGALTKGKSLDSDDSEEPGPDTLDFMLNELRKDYAANARTQPVPLSRDQQPEVNPNTPTKLVDRIIQLPALILVVLSLAAGGLVALFLVGIALIALRFNL